jgi:UDP-N-acetylglucosamine/UDP-N-acetyl-alpha-D-glucosaminouronate 4-epimerase
MPFALVTGGAGFIGSHLVEGLLKSGYAVRVLDNFATGRRDNIKHICYKIELMEGDIRNLTTVHAAMRQVDVVFHHAALPQVARSVEHPEESNAVNIAGTLNVLIAARDAQVKRVVYASSSSVYGNAPELPKVETMIPEPLSPYAVAKLAGEHYARVFQQLYGLSTVTLRYFNVFGPRQDPTTQYAGVIAKFISCALEGKPYPVDGDGEQSRDFTYVENVVRANLAAVQVPLVGATLMNIACGTRTTINQIPALLNELTHQNLPSLHRAERPGDVRHSLASIELAKDALDYAPTIDLHDGLRRTLDWYRGK